MSSVDDIKRAYNSPDSVTKRKMLEKENRLKQQDKEAKEMEEAMREVDEVLLGCKDAAENGCGSFYLNRAISQTAKQILRQKGIGITVNARMCGCTTEFWGWGN